MKRPAQVSAELMPSAVRLAEQLFLALAPHGGQRTSRRNAWMAVAANERAAADREEVEQFRGTTKPPLRLVVGVRD